MNQKELNKKLDLCKKNGVALDLSNQDCSGLNFSDAILSCAILSCADLRGAILSCADLRGAILSGADLSCADLRGAILSRVDLSCADLRNALGVSQFIRCPQEGQFIGYKKSEEGLIVKLGIPKSAQRVNAIGSFKCRADKAKVLGIYNQNGSESDIQEVTSEYDKNFKYRVGQTVRVNNFNDSDRLECEAGIHFFMTFQEAVEY